MAQISVDWLPREGPSQDGFSYGGVILGWPPNHTRCAVATGPAVGGGTQNDPKSLTLEDCKGMTNKRVTCILFELCGKAKRVQHKTNTHKCIFLALCLNVVQSDSEKSGAAHPKFKNSSLVLIRLVSAKYSVKIHAITS